MKDLKEFALWKNGLSSFQKEEFEEGGFDRIYGMLAKREDRK
jgi:hypothetical protein